LLEIFLYSAVFFILVGIWEVGSVYMVSTNGQDQKHLTSKVKLAYFYIFLLNNPYWQFCYLATWGSRFSSLITWTIL